MPLVGDDVAPDFVELLRRMMFLRLKMVLRLRLPARAFSLCLSLSLKGDACSEEEEEEDSFVSNDETLESRSLGKMKGNSQKSESPNVKRDLSKFQKRPIEVAAAPRSPYVILLYKIIIIYYL